MPKEITYSDNPAFMLQDDGSELPASEQPPGTGQAVLQRGVHVGWNRNKHVEVGVATFEISTESMHGGQFVSLDRDGCNRLIHSVRKARDAAFGKDA